MVLLLLLLMMETPSASWEYTETEIFGTLYRDEVALHSESGDLFILSFDEAKVTVLNANGAVSRTFGQKGDGPGEMTFPTSIRLHDDVLYIQDVLTTSLSIFTVQGDFIKRQVLPGRDLPVVKSNGGWFYGNWHTFKTENGIVFRAEEAFENPQQVRLFKDPGYAGGATTWVVGGKARSWCSPLTNWPMLRTSPDGALVYVTNPNAPSIDVFDAQGKRVRTITLNDKPIPFDEEWAKEEMAENLEILKKQEPNAELVIPRPKYFPFIRDLVVMPDGKLVVDRWRGRPKNNHHPITLDSKGNTIKDGYDWDVAVRLIGFHGEHAYVRIYDADEEMGGVARVSKSDLAAYIKANPMPEEPRPRPISFSE